MNGLGPVRLNSPPLIGVRLPTLNAPTNVRGEGPPKTGRTVEILDSSGVSTDGETEEPSTDSPRASISSVD